MPPPDKAPLANAPEAPQGNQDIAKNAGRGGVAVAGAKLWFILTGLLQQTLLPHLIGLDGYGAFSTVQSFANIPNNVVVSSSIQTMSRAVAAEAGPANEAQAQRRALRHHLLLAPALALLVVAVTPAFAAFEHAPQITTPLRILAVVLFAYALYAPLIGSLNGRRRFLAQASLDITSATLRTFALLLGSWLLAKSGHGVLGACMGLAIAALCMLPIAGRLAGTGTEGPRGPRAGEYFPFLGRVATGQLFLNLVMQADIWLVRRFGHESGRELGLVGDLLESQTDKLVGSYRAAQLFAFLPYQLLLSITFILFPMLARSAAARDTAAVRTYVRTGVRLGIILAGLMVGTVSALAPQLLRFAFPIEASQQAGDSLRILALGQGAFALFGIETTVLTSLGREKDSAWITGATAATIALLCTLLVPHSTFGSPLLVHTALATSSALTLAAIVGALLVRRTAGAFASPLTLIRSIGAVAVTVVLGSRLPWWGRPGLILEMLLVAAVYLALQILSGEITRGDAAMVRRALIGKR